MVALARVIDSRVAVQVRLLGLAGLAFVAVGGFLALFGRNPVVAYAEIFRGALGSSYGISEVVVRAIPLMLCAVATALPARMGLLNVGPEGQLHAGALAVTWGVLTFGSLPRGVFLPVLIALQVVGPRL